MDFVVRGSGTVYLVSPQNEQAREWVDENVGLEEWQGSGHQSFAVEHRYIEDLVGGMLAEGFKVEVNDREVCLAPT